MVFSFGVSITTSKAPFLPLSVIFNFSLLSVVFTIMRNFSSLAFLSIVHSSKLMAETPQKVATAQLAEVFTTPKEKNKMIRRAGRRFPSTYV
ncbi:hypothetical protein BY458DRAFT_124304 [Sporodiniella umbellata]|nr:hypothetical protein BY458DRAFT_124304 [Sporodiniella umbellata]